MLWKFPLALIAVALTGVAQAGAPFNEVAEEVNSKMVKIYGFGGFRGVDAFASGIVVSPDGGILTAALPMFGNANLSVHLADGRRMTAKVLYVEPELDLALLKVIDESGKLNIPYFDIAEAARAPHAEPGDWILSSANLFEIAFNEEAVSCQRGVIAAYGKLHGRRGIFDFSFAGNVYIVDAITNNPGAPGGALTDRKGRLLGVVGKELRNSLTETWVNYSIPVDSKVEVKVGDKTTVVSVAGLVDEGLKGKYKPVVRPREVVGIGGFHGLEFVPNVIDRTPAYVEEVVAGSPAAKAGIKPDDLVSFLDGEPIPHIKAFHEILRRTRAGTVIRLEIRRGGALQTFDLKLEEYPKGAKKPPLPPGTAPMGTSPSPASTTPAPTPKN